MPDRPASGGLVLAPGTLWTDLLRATRRATRAGALHSIATQATIVEDAGVGFVVRVAAGPPRKPRPAARPTPGAREPDPFLPYDPAMLVAELSRTHVGLLNKYNVIEPHLLVVTRAFEDQRALLTEDDLVALWACLAEFDGLAFYNAGPEAGASQPHKHLQVVPLPLAPAGRGTPMDDALAAARGAGGCASSPALPFRHAIGRVDPRWLDAPASAGPSALAAYADLLRAAGLPDDPRGAAGAPQSAPYNLLATRRWTLLVPRRRERFGAISVNALGFAGGLLVWGEGQRRELQRAGPLAVLAHVGCPPAP